MSTRKIHICNDCKRTKDRCRAASVDEHGNIVWICRNCWREKDYDAFMYEHRVQQEA